MNAPLRTLLKSSLAALALIAGLAVSGREAKAQATYVGTFALANGASDEFLTGPNYAPFNSREIAMYNWSAIPAQQWAFFRLPSGFYAIMNIQSGVFLEDPAASGANVPVDEYQWFGGLNQQWFLYPLGNNFYALVNAASGKMLTDPRTLDPQNEMDVAIQDLWFDGLSQWWYLAFLRY